MNESDVRVEFGRRVKTLRLERRMSQERLGLMAGLDRTYISQTEAGRRNVTLVTIHKLADALGVEVASLFAGSGDDMGLTVRQ